ncbi:MAG: tRNA (adenosine(37)-N6)-dimethylallyltransferase MiaA, partial [Flavobacteriales bacterium]|nr:tRNA (adenosine(37)-N6)-dimethylallyltransferase MiaA [Flavobacteriales bacterium]
IYGPTAVGKTTYAIKLAQELNTEILSADSRQFYKEMKIGTAVPEKEELESVKHHFIQHKSIHEDYNVGLFERDAINKIDELFKRFDTLIMVGGSGLYMDGVCKGLDSFPEITPTLRENLRQDYLKNGLEWLQNEVKIFDPEYFKSADIHNHQRLLRCLEVCRQSGQSYSSFKKAQKNIRPFEVEYYSIKMDRETLYNRINKRVDIMMDKGLLSEVESLKNFQHLNALKTVGYKELFSHLNNELTLKQAVDQIKQNTRRYAKRQLTWLNRYPIKWVES